MMTVYIYIYMERREGKERYEVGEKLVCELWALFSDFYLWVIRIYNEAGFVVFIRKM